MRLQEMKLDRRDKIYFATWIPFAFLSVIALFLGCIVTWAFFNGLTFITILIYISGILKRAFEGYKRRKRDFDYWFALMCLSFIICVSIFAIRLDVHILLGI